MRATALIVLLAAGCSDKPTLPANPHAEAPAGVGPCVSSADCAGDQWCLHDRCSSQPGPPTDQPVPRAHLSVAPASINFGALTPPGRRRLGVVLQNDGETMVTLRRARILPDGAPFQVEPVGYGPFWIRPGRSRDLFVTFAPADAAAHAATLLIESDAPEVGVQLLGN